MSNREIQLVRVSSDEDGMVEEDIIYHPEDHRYQHPRLSIDELDALMQFFGTKPTLH